ncbi:MAG TPA: SufS family cysteine desulfurase [Candidatus Babeliales bacterium]|jgi:cysteine desulfurase/selenocysteine lyase|nr:SufS family cysteine desulfurase [Candidatus Babeliales bacterium]
MNKFKKLRDDFPILHQEVNGYSLIACDNASTAHKPQTVIDAVVQFYTTINANTFRGVYLFAEEATRQYETARTKVAQFIGADPEEVIFTRGCTSGINFIAATWADTNIQAGDEIVITELEHHSNLLPWQRLAQKKGAILKFIPVLSDGTVDLSNLDSIITNKTKMVSVIHVSNATGAHVDIVPIIQRAHAVGARILIDAAQSASHQKINVHELDCDFLVFSGHKLLGPTGIGVLYIKKELHSKIEPYEVGGGMVAHVECDHATWAPAPQKFEAGTPPIAQAIGLGAAIDYLQEHINFDELIVYEAQLCARLIDGLAEIKGIKILGPIQELKEKGHMVSFLVENYHSHDVAAFLDKRGIFVRAGHHCAQPFAHKLGYDASVRVSFYFYNTFEEVDAIIAALKELVKF